MHADAHARCGERSPSTAAPAYARPPHVYVQRESQCNTAPRLRTLNQGSMYPDASSRGQSRQSAGRLANAKERTEDMVDTLAVFQPPTFWLKADAESNICER